MKKPKVVTHTPLDLPELVAIRATTEAEKKVMRAYSNSRLEDMSWCPTWGVVHSKKKYKTEARSMALEAGEVMHQVFAGVRLWQLDRVQKLKKHALYHGERLFGKDRWATCWEKITSRMDEREQLTELAFAILDTSDFNDDPQDSERTIQNMQMASIHYIDERIPHMDTWEIYVKNKKDPKSQIGIEQVFDVVLEYSDKHKIRYIGTVDGLIWNIHKEKYYIDENKTAARMDKGWRLSFDMKHQPTGYCAASTTIFGFEVLNVRVTGSKIKPVNRGEDVHVLEISRTADDIHHWGNWIRFVVDLYEKYEHHFEQAPRYTHACNRFFRPCSLLAFCGDTSQGRIIQYDEMVPIDPSPSEKAVLDI